MLELRQILTDNEQMEGFRVDRVEFPDHVSGLRGRDDESDAHRVTRPGDLRFISSLNRYSPVSGGAISTNAIAHFEHLPGAVA